MNKSQANQILAIFVSIPGILLQRIQIIETALDAPLYFQ
jgi:hypothetical protein